MRFSKTKNIYKIIRITGSQDNILGGCFGENDINDIEVIEWYFPNIKESHGRTSKEEVLEQVISGLNYVNKLLGTNYKLSKINFSPFDNSSAHVYLYLISILIEHYHNGKEFIEVSTEFLEK